MSGNNLELSVWGEGKIKLAFWDSIHGNDRIFSLTSDGMSFEDVIEGDREISQCVDLVHELRKMALQMASAAS